MPSNAARIHKIIDQLRDVEDWLAKRRTIATMIVRAEVESHLENMQEEVRILLAKIRREEEWDRKAVGP